MGATVIAYWPGITEKQYDSQPGFRQDDRAWGNWMAEREGEPEVLRAIVDLGAAAILTATTDGWDDEDVTWVTPQELLGAARTLHHAVEHRHPAVGRILAVYARNANGLDSLVDEFLTDLADIAAIARWAEGEGANKMTLYVSW